jgi:hypothetical protein
MTTQLFSKQQLGIVLVAALFGVLSVMPLSASAATCSFTRDLQMNSVGEDVRCLQQFLNNGGYTITTSGGGAPGNETTEFRSLTQAAVVKWQQAKGISPASGYFGPKSRAAYAASAGGSTPTTPSTSVGDASNASMLAQGFSVTKWSRRNGPDLPWARIPTMRGPRAS